MCVLILLALKAEHSSTLPDQNEAAGAADACGVSEYGPRGYGAFELASVTEKGVSVTKLIQRMREELVRRNFAESTMRTYLQVVEDFRRYSPTRLDQRRPDD